MRRRRIRGIGTKPVIPSAIFELFYLQNRGAAFGILANRQWVFVMIALAMVAVAIYVYVYLPVTSHFPTMRICTVLIAAGAAGNMIDRLLHRYVIDFLYVSLIDFPVFNVADCYVVVGALLLIVLIFTLYRNDNFECLNPEKE
ncbi:MAG: signal peptidase II [Lachnospiraceae bacterium]